MAEENLKKLAKDKAVVTISEDGMNVYLNLYPLTAGEKYSGSDMEEILLKHNVIYGINQDAVNKLVEEEIVYTDVLVAEGIPCKDGADGQFEFLFKTDIERKPKILPDGSADYNSMGAMEVVEAGSEIVKYHPAVKGTNGITVKGAILSGKNGKELAPLKGKGFTLSEDKLIYIASVSGKVEYHDGKLTVSNLLEIKEDVTHATGNVEFSGDVHITGAIFTGMTVKAYGNIIVDGHVEAAELIAGKDIVLKNGMQGAGKGSAHAGGNISGKFFEQTIVSCKGNLSTNAMLNCDVKVDGDVIALGKLGVIIGGTIFARQGIYATIIGNTSEVKTKLILGSDKELVPEIMNIENEIEQMQEAVNKYSNGIDQITALIERKPSADLMDKKLQLIRAKIEKESKLAILHSGKNDLVLNLEKALHSKLVVGKSIYPGTRIIMSGSKMILETENYNVSYVRRGVDIMAIPNV